MQLVIVLRGLAFAVVLLVLGALPASAATFTVDDGAVPGGGCTNPFNTISAAVACANPGDTINVASGTYNESVTVSVSNLTINGAQRDVDARTRSVAASAESTVNGTPNENGFFVTTGTSNVTINGFRVQNAVEHGAGGLDGVGIYLQGGSSNVRILNNIIRDNGFGLYLNGSNQLVRQNRFIDNNAAGSASGNGIYSDQGLTSSTIDRNRSSGHANGGMPLIGQIPAIPGTVPVTNLTVTNNQSDGDLNGVFATAVKTASFTDNTFINSTGFHGMQFDGGNDNITITRNTVSNNNFSAIRLNSDTDVTPNSDFTIVSNTLLNNGDFGINADDNFDGSFEFHFNHIFSNDTGGARNVTGTEMEAENNFWGCNEGPNSAGGCDSVTGNVDFDPWLILSILPPTPCLGDNGQTFQSQVVASLTRNSNGAETSGQGFVPNGTIINFSASSGSVDPASAGTVNGRATTNFTGSIGRRGDGHRVDRQRVRVGCRCNTVVTAAGLHEWRERPEQRRPRGRGRRQAEGDRGAAPAARAHQQLQHGRVPHRG